MSHMSDLSTTTVAINAHLRSLALNAEQITDADTAALNVHEVALAALAADVAQRGTTSAQLYDQVLARLPKSVTLFYRDRNDAFDADQVQVMLDGGNVYDDAAFTAIEESMSDSNYHYAMGVIEEHASEVEREVLADADLLDDLRVEVEQRDDSDYVADILNGTPSMLFRYDLDFDMPEGPTADDPAVADQVEDTMVKLGIADTPAHREAVLDMIVNAFYGGALEMIWYGDPAEAVDLATGPTPDYTGEVEQREVGAITFSPAHVLIRDGLNGSGHEATFESVTVPWRTRNVRADAAKGGGYSWNEIAGPVHAYYDSNVSTTATDQEVSA